MQCLTVFVVLHAQCDAFFNVNIAISALIQSVYMKVGWISYKKSSRACKYITATNTSYTAYCMHAADIMKLFLLLKLGEYNVEAKMLFGIEYNHSDFLQVSLWCA